MYTLWDLDVMSTIILPNPATSFLGETFVRSNSSTLHLVNDLIPRKLTNIYASVNGSEDDDLATQAGGGAECRFFGGEREFTPVHFVNCALFH